MNAETAGTATTGLLGLDWSAGSRIIGLAGPTMLAMLTQTAINQVDHILVGRLPASESVPGQSALQVSLILLWAVGGSLAAISVGTQALTARRLGEGAPKEAGRVLASSLTIAVVFGSLLSLLAWIFTPEIFRLVNRDETVVSLGVPFLRYRYLQVLPMVVSVSFKSFFDGMGKTWVHLVVAIVMNVVNFVLALGLVFGTLGMPRLGVAGAGLASCLSSWVGAAMMLGFSLRGAFRHRFEYYRFGAPSRRLALEIARLSIPSAVAALFAMGGFGFFLWVVGRLDQPGHPILTSATSNIINIFQLVFILGIAYGTATSTLVGHNMGAKKFDVAARFGHEAAKLGFLIFLPAGLLAFSFPDLILHGWCKDLEVITVAAPILRVLALLAPVMAVALTYTYALYGAGNSLFVMAVEGILHFTCLMPLSYLLAMTFGFGIWGVWSAMMAYVVLLTVIMAWKFRGGSWKSIRI